MKTRIKITDIEGIRIGNAQDYDAMTGVTVILFDVENNGGVDVSGGGPASREVHLLSPVTNRNSLHALVLSGGSAYGLDASGGVMRYLEERGKGLHVANAIVPLVCQSCIFDLGIGNGKVRPDADMAYKACENAEQNEAISGNVGAGTGASVGKLLGIHRAQKSGIGYYAVQIGELKVGAVVVVNAVGDIFDYKTGRKIAGMLTEDRTEFADAEEVMFQIKAEGAEGANTTIGAVFTNAAFDKANMNKIASMARSAYSRCINPVGTMADGDTIYAMSVGKVKADINMVGTLAATVLSEAILDAVRSAKMEEKEFLSKFK